MFCLATLIADQQKSCEKTPSSPLLIDTIEQHYAQFFLQQLKKLQQYEPKLPELISFLEQHFHNTAWGIVSPFSFPLGAQTQILKAIACECSRQTSQPPQDFLLPGVLLTYEQQQLDMTVLLATHILSSDKKRLIPAIAAFDEQQFEQLTPDEQHAVKHHSFHTHTYRKTLEYQRCSAPNHYDFLARLKQLRTALRHPQSSITCILEFEYYYKNTLSEKMRAAIPEPIRQSLELLLSSFASQHGNKAFGNNTLFMANPDLLDKFDFDYDHYYHLFNNTALRSFSSVSEQVPKDVTEQRGQQLIAFAPMGSQRGFARQQLLLKIGISLNINSIADLTILESIMPEEMSQIFIENQQPAPGHGALPQLALMLGGSNLLILFQRLEPAQVRAFCQLFPAHTWIEALPVFEKLYRLLRFFREDKALTYAIISGLQLVLPDLLEHYTHKSQSSRHSLDSILHHSLFTPQELQWLDDALIAEITSLKKQSFFHNFLQRARPKSYFTHDFWVNKMYCDSKEIKQYLPYLPAPTQNYLIKRLLGQMLLPESIITPDVRTLLFYFTLSKKNKLPEYNTLMQLFNQGDQIMLCHLLAQSHESQTFIQDFFDIIHVILLNQPKHTMRFLINCTRHYPTWHMLTYPQYFLALAESFVHRIPHCHRILISALAGSLTWPMNEQNRSTPSVFRHLAAVAQKDIHFAQSLCAHPATHFSIFYNNSAEQVEVLNLLTRMSPHSPVRQLYDDAKRDDFALLKEQMLTEDPTTALRAIGLWVRFVALRGSAAECQIFFHEIFLEVVKKHASSLVISGSEHTEQLMKSLSPDHQKTFKHFLLTLPIFNSLSKKIRQSVLESAMRHIRQESSFLCAFFKESGVMRSVLYEKLEVFDMTFSETT